MIRRALLVASVVVAPLACRKEPASPPQTVDAPVPAGGLEVREVQLGKSIGADKKVVMPVTAFAPLDTVFVSIATGGSGMTAVLSARWSMVRDRRSEVVDSTAQTVAPGGPAVTEFHVSNPGGWPPGRYRVEVFTDDKRVATRDFEVR